MNEPAVLLGIYMNDHLAGATAGLQLFRRAAAQAVGPAQVELRQMAAEVEQDRESLLAMMRALGVPVRRYKALSGWVLEKAGRLKANGHLLGRSPLNDVVKLEASVLGVQGKAAGFKTLRSVATGPHGLTVRELDRLIDRAERQAESLERLRLQAAVRTLAAPVPPATAGET